MKHSAFVMNVAPPAKPTPAQWAVFCLGCANEGRPKMIVPPTTLMGQTLLRTSQQTFARQHNKGYI